MRIAVPLTQAGRFNQHFGQTRVFQVFDIDDQTSRIRHSHQLGIPDHGGCGAIPPLLAREGVMKVIAGGMGAGAAANLEHFRIEPILGASGDDPQRVVLDYLAGCLSVTSQPCSGHGHGEHHDSASGDHQHHPENAHGSCCTPTKEQP